MGLNVYKPHNFYEQSKEEEFVEKNLKIAHLCIAALTTALILIKVNAFKQPFLITFIMLIGLVLLSIPYSYYILKPAHLISNLIAKRKNYNCFQFVKLYNILAVITMFIVYYIIINTSFTEIFLDFLHENYLL